MNTSECQKQTILSKLCMISNIIFFLFFFSCPKHLINKSNLCTAHIFGHARSEYVLFQVLAVSSLFLLLIQIFQQHTTYICAGLNMLDNPKVKKNVGQAIVSHQSVTFTILAQKYVDHTILPQKYVD